MGGKGSTEHHYIVSPEVTAQLENQKKQIDAFKEEAKQREDPKLFKQNAQQLLNKFMDGLDKLQLQDAISKSPGERHVGILGPTSCGKTSMINVMFDKHLPVALGECTKECKIVHAQSDGLVIWDSPGENDDYLFYKAENLGFVRSLDLVVVLFDSDITKITNILQVVFKLHPTNLIVVRTKVDQCDASNIRGVDEEKKLDSQKIRNLLGTSLPTYAISSRAIMTARSERTAICTYDWSALEQCIINPKDTKTVVSV